MDTGKAKGSKIVEFFHLLENTVDYYDHIFLELGEHPSSRFACEVYYVLLLSIIP